MTQYKVDVIGAQAQDQIFDDLTGAFECIQELLEAGKQLEISAVADVAVEAPVEGDGDPKTTDTLDTDDTDEPATDPKDSDLLDADNDDEDAADDDDDELSGEEIDDKTNFKL